MNNSLCSQHNELLQNLVTNHFSQIVKNITEKGNIISAKVKKERQAVLTVCLFFKNFPRLVSASIIFLFQNKVIDGLAIVGAGIMILEIDAFVFQKFIVSAIRQFVEQGTFNQHFVSGL